MSVQTSYSRLTDERLHGSLYDLQNNEVVSGDAEAVIKVGVAVARGTNEGQLLVASDASFFGIAIRDLSKEATYRTATAPFSIDYAIGDNVSVLKSGYINLTCPAGCSAGDPVKFTDATGVINAGVAGAGETAIGGATWETTTAAGQVGVVRLPSSVTIA